MIFLSEIFNKIKRGFSYIFSEDENLTLENRLYISALLVGILISALAAVIVFIISPTKIAFIANITLFCSLIVIYWFAKFRKITEPFKMPIIIIAFFGIATIWVFDGGMDGPDMMIALVILMLALIIAPNRYKKFIISLFLSLIITIYLIERIRPDLIVKIPSASGKWFDSFLTAIYCSVFIYLIIQFMHRHYSLEKNKAEANETKFRNYLESAPDAVFVVNSEGLLIEVNTAACRLLGYTKEELHFKSVLKIFGQGESEKFVQAFTALNKTGNFSSEITLVRENGSTLIGLLEAVKIGNNQYLGFVKDITERKKVQDEMYALNSRLKELNYDKDRFIAILAHDLKSPFNALLGLSELLANEVKSYDKERVEQFAINIHKSARKTYDLLDDLLMWTQAKSGKLPFNPQVLNFWSVCNDVLDIFQPAAQEKSINIYLNADKNLSLYGDPEMLKTILRNLISNAIKFSFRGGSISISAEKDKKNAVVTVSDNGVGIQPDVMTKLFDTYQFHSADGTSGEKGTGLGLILCKEFVEKHGGKIWVEQNIENGSSFKISIPLLDS